METLTIGSFTVVLPIPWQWLHVVAWILLKMHKHCKILCYHWVSTQTQILQCWESAMAISNRILTYVSSVVEMAPFKNIRYPHSLNNQSSFVLWLLVFLTLKHRLGWSKHYVWCQGFRLGAFCYRESGCYGHVKSLVSTLNVPENTDQVLTACWVVTV